jgi:hypothetical protein
MATFDITRKTPVVTLGRDRRGSVRFTITNLATRPMTVHLTAIPQVAADAALFTFDKPAEQIIEPNKALTIDVLVAPDKKTAPGKHSFTVKVADVDQPDEYYAESQPVEFDVPPVIEEGGRRVRWGLIAAVAAVVVILAGAAWWFLRAPEETSFDQGYMLPHFVTDLDRQVVILDNPKILVCDTPIDKLPALLSESAGANPAPFLIIANLGERSRFFFELGVARGQLELEPGKTIRLAAVALPETGSGRTQALKRIARFAGTRVIESEEQMKKVSMADLGTVRRVLITDRRTTLCKQPDGGCR